MFRIIPLGELDELGKRGETGKKNEEKACFDKVASELLFLKLTWFRVVGVCFLVSKKMFTCKYIVVLIKALQHILFSLILLISCN